MLNNKTKEQVISVQMSELEYAGLVKLDCLSLNTLDRLNSINSI